MNRRSFLSAILAAGVAPAVVGSGILMPVRKIIVPGPDGLLGPVGPGPCPEGPHILYGDGVRDDYAAMQALLDGKRVIYEDGTLVAGGTIRGLRVRVSKTLRISSNTTIEGCQIISPEREILFADGANSKNIAIINNVLWSSADTDVMAERNYSAPTIVDDGNRWVTGDPKWSTSS